LKDRRGFSSPQRGERVEHFETLRVRKDGSFVNVSLTISPVKGADGRIVGASKVARDITEKVRQEAALQEANAALKRANADLQQFAYSASHDLQEPLRMVAIYSELLQKRFGGQLGPTGDEYIGYTVLGATRMDNLLKDLRAYAQVSTVGKDPSDDIDAEEILKKVLLNLELAIKDSGASISNTALPSVRMYAYQLEQVFQNLRNTPRRAQRHRPRRPRRLANVSPNTKPTDWIFPSENAITPVCLDVSQNVYNKVGILRQRDAVNTRQRTQERPQEEKDEQRMMQQDVVSTVQNAAA
jgi:light-regulated signal transduction histidine kinase (bacteriophytochrome)